MSEGGDLVFGGLDGGAGGEKGGRRRGKGGKGGGEGVGGGGGGGLVFSSLSLFFSLLSSPFLLSGGSNRGQGSRFHAYFFLDGLG